jgi:hypothetical protein
MLAVLREDLFMSLAPETTGLFWYGGMEKVSLQRLEDFSAMSEERSKQQQCHQAATSLCKDIKVIFTPTPPATTAVLGSLPL